MTTDVKLKIIYLQLASGPAVHRYGRQLLDGLLAGFSFHYAKPMLVAEIRRIVPTVVGLPMELGFYTAAVAAAAVECKVHFYSFTITG